ncbi:glycosyltransferase family 2 protein [Streptomyces sp. H39-S7]|uniref:glycosyltransferase family 2 protein n=1 Tax=Streptomyces sp. H39-S7 TaxID=3004357 RepID=UPI0022AFC4EB|nr:glycosyltransferase family A protein [Streptomyces sp. H39-S7]MCZ4121793.1 glycosyltransferase family A protein [Streptomyces sp. H39-S7]
MSCSRTTTSSKGPRSVSRPTDRPTVGVIVPAMNSSDFIDQALGSVAMQTRPVDQIVVVDDCSDDDTVRRVERWSGVLPLTLVRNTRRLGVWGARGTGIERLGTDLVCQLDGDDAFLPHHVEAMCDAYDASPGLISPRPLTWTGRGPFVPGTYTKGRLPLPGDQLVQLLAQNYVVVGALYSRALYDKVGGFRQIAYGEEWDLWLRLVAAGAVVSKPADPSYVYRVRSSSYAGGFARNEAETEVLGRFLAETGDPRLRRAVKIALLQRTGTDGLPEAHDPLAAAGVDAAVLTRAGLGRDHLVYVRRDPDLGWVLSGRDEETGGPATAVIADDGRPVLRMTGGQNDCEVTFVEDELLRRDTSSLRDVLRC